MSSEYLRISDFLDTLRSRVSERALELADDGEEFPSIVFREEAFTEVLLETLEDLGQIPGTEICYFERRLGRAIGKINAWHADEGNAQVDLVATIYRGLKEPGSVTATDLGQTVRRAAQVFLAAREGFHDRMEPASAAFDMMQRLHEVWHRINRVRIIVLADGLAGDGGKLVVDLGGPELQVDIWDLRRVFRAASSGLPYEPVEIDLVQRIGAAIPCLPMPLGAADYQCYLTIFPGSFLHSIYHEFGPRLLELNVRSFLQARGKVNRGIRDTLRETPERFMAYNNGISVTAEHLELEARTDGTWAIQSITGLQIVNGGQTVASIHRAREQDKVDLTDVCVQAKITVVRPDQVETFVPLVSRYANTQNRVNEADFSANHPYHVRIQQLSQTIWTPGEQSRWFYERARGQYHVARARQGSTLARRRSFDATTPTAQKFDKVQLAKYINAWDQLPHIVSRGGQKSFVHFMERLARLHSVSWEPDADYYRVLIAKAIIFKRAEKIARMHKFPGYRANAVAYTVALTSYRTAGRVNFEEIWNTQEVGQALADTLYDWMLQIYDEIITSAGQRNVTEWCKREECWRHIQMVAVDVPAALERELSAGQPLPTVGESAGRRGANLTSEDLENIARVMQVGAEEWVYISSWGARTGHLQEWQIGIATTLAAYAAAGWNKVPSGKQSNQGVRILRIADEEGGRIPVDQTL